MSNHRWSGWPGAWCLDCGLEDGVEIDIAGIPGETHHRYSDIPHTENPCKGCSRSECLEVGSRKHDPYSVVLEDEDRD